MPQLIVQCCLWLIRVSLLCHSTSAGAWQWPGLQSTELSLGQAERHGSHKKMVQSALDLILKFDALPPCQRIATKGMLNACGAFDLLQPPASVPADEEIEDYQKLFAIRMTRCELQDTNLVLPIQCQMLIHEIPRSEQLRQNLPPCIFALEELGTNAWTTYQVQKPPATILCQVMRGQHYSDESLRFLATLAESLGLMGKAAEEFRAELQSKLKELNESIHDILLDIKIDWENTRAIMNHGFSEVQENLRSTSQDIVHLEQQAVGSLKLLSEDMKDTLSNVASLGTDVARYGATVGNINSEVEIIHSRFISNAEVAIGHFADKFDALVNSVELGANNSAEFLAHVHRLRDDLGASVGLIVEINSGVSNALTTQRKLMDELQEIQVGIESTHESLARVDEAATKLAKIGSGVSSFLGWFQESGLNEMTWQLWVLVSGLIFIIFSTYVNLQGASAVLVAATTGLALSSMFAPIMSFLPSSYSAFEILTYHPRFLMIVSGFLLSFLVGVFTQYIWTSLRKFITTWQEGRASEMEYDPESPEYFWPIETTQIKF